jgi:pimeloyl-ACP methyl ester carboxylesterase
VVRRRPDVVDRYLRKAGMTQAEVARFHREIVEYGALPGALAWYRAIPFSAASSTGPVRVPTTHVWSDRDSALSRRGAELTAEYVQAPYELRVLSGVNHWIPTHAPELLADIVLARIGSVT